MNPIKYLIFTVLCLSVTSTFAQININAGFIYTKPDRLYSVNRIVNDYNASDTARAMDRMFNLVGMGLGMRYNLDNIRFHFEWINKYQRLKDKRSRPNRTSEYQTSLYYRDNSFNLGMELYYGWIGIGGSVNYNEVIMKYDRLISGSVKNQPIFSQGGFGSEAYLNLELPVNEAIALSIRPFYQWTYHTVDFIDAEKIMAPKKAETANLEEFKERPYYFGIKFLLVNGGRRSAQ